MKDFSNAKPGDKVFLESGGWGRVLNIRTIHKVGKVHFTLNGSSTKYRVKSGYEAGDSYRSDFVTPYDEQKWSEYVAERTLQKMRYDLRDYNWMGCDPELIAAVHALTHSSDATDGQTWTLRKVSSETNSY